MQRTPFFRCAVFNSKLPIKSSIIWVLLVSFFLTTNLVHASSVVIEAGDIVLPQPGAMVSLSPSVNSPVLKGLKVYPDNPFRFDFILDHGDVAKSSLQEESSRLIKYFLTSLTMPEKDLWVNLSPYEKNRVIPDSFGLTIMGRDLLAEDYILKQITASLIYPEDEIGNKFWKRIYEEAAKKYGTTDIPVNTFNKVWIVPQKAVVYENSAEGVAYVVESKLKVMLEEDYLSREKQVEQSVQDSSLGSAIVREIVIPALTKEVNEGKNFIQLRQVYNSLILASWYKRKIKDSILSEVYANRQKTAGVEFNGARDKQKISLNPEIIYQQYLQAFKKGVYNYVKEEVDPVTKEVLPRKYFSGGVQFGEGIDAAMIINTNRGWLNTINRNALMLITAGITFAATALPAKQVESVKLGPVPIEQAQSGKEAGLIRGELIKQHLPNSIIMKEESSFTQEQKRQSILDRLEQIIRNLAEMVKKLIRVVLRIIEGIWQLWVKFVSLFTADNFIRLGIFIVIFFGLSSVFEFIDLGVTALVMYRIKDKQISSGWMVQRLLRKGSLLGKVKKIRRTEYRKGILEILEKKEKVDVFVLKEVAGLLSGQDTQFQQRIESLLNKHVNEISQNQEVALDILLYSIPVNEFEFNDSRKSLVDHIVLSLLPSWNTSTWDMLVKAVDVRILGFLTKNYPQLVNQGGSDLLKETVSLVDAIEMEVAKYPANVQSKMREELFEAVNKYAVGFAANEKLEEYRRVLSYVNIVHDNISLVLNACRALKIGLSEFDDIRAALPINNPLTRVIRFLGEKKNIGGFIDVSQTLIKKRQWNFFKQIILEMVISKGRQSPSLIESLLGILRTFPDQMPTSEMEWKQLKERTENFTRICRNVPLITPNLYQFYLKNENNPHELVRLSMDVAEELRGMQWGGFKGLSQRFKDTYGLSDYDEVAIVSYYVPSSNMAIGDFVFMYNSLKETLLRRGNRWTNEVPIELRQLYSTVGSQMRLVYNEGANREVNEGETHQLLTRFAKQAKIDTSNIFRKFIQEPSTENISELQSMLISFAIEQNGLDRKQYLTVPDDAEGRKSWLERWQNLLGRAYYPEILKASMDMIQQNLAGMQEEEIKKLIVRFKVPSFIALMDREWREDDEMVRIIANEGLDIEDKQEALVRVFKNKWFSLVYSQDLRNDAVFNGWIKADEISKLAARLLTKAKIKAQKNRKEVTIEQSAVEALLMQSIRAGRAVSLAEYGSQTDYQRINHIIAAQIFTAAWKSFDPSRTQIEAYLNRFSLTKMQGTKTLYIGFFDDLLHQMEPMLTGVCTSSCRPTQVNNTKQHFGEIAIKDDGGRVLGFSQVQILKNQIKNLPEGKSNHPKGWNVLSLPGINLRQGDIGTTQEEAVLAILESAQRLAQKNGFQAAVVPQNMNISTNSESIKTFLLSLVAKGWLKKATLDKNVVLSSEPAYSYSGVYLVVIPEENYSLNEVPIEDLPSGVEEQKATGEIKRVNFYDHFGVLEYDDGQFTEPEMFWLKEKIEATVKQMSPRVVEDIRMSAIVADVELFVKVDIQAQTSRIIKTPNKIELILGRDVHYGVNKIDSVTFEDLMAEMMAASVLEDYVALKEASRSNENAYFKLENIKGLINLKGYLMKYYKVVRRFNWTPAQFIDENPSETQVLSELQRDLERFNSKAKDIRQWNVFLSVMDDADPDFLIINYLYLLSKRNPTDKEVTEIIQALTQLDVMNQPSLARLRDFTKEVFLKGTAWLQVGSNPKKVTAFSFWGDWFKGQDYRRALRAKNQNDFYKVVRNLLSAMLPLSDAELNKEVDALLNDDLFSSEKRLEEVRKRFKEIFIRRLGSKAYTALETHLKAKRGNQFIPFYRMSQLDLDFGDDADDYDPFIYMATGQEFILTDKEGRENTTEDFVLKLFPMRADSAMAVQSDAAGRTPQARLESIIRSFEQRVSLNKEIHPREPKAYRRVNFWWQNAFIEAMNRFENPLLENARSDYAYNLLAASVWAQRPNVWKRWSNRARKTGAIIHPQTADLNDRLAVRPQELILPDQLVIRDGYYVTFSELFLNKNNSWCVDIKYQKKGALFRVGELRLGWDERTNSWVAVDIPHRIKDAYRGQGLGQEGYSKLVDVFGVIRSAGITPEGLSPAAYRMWERLKVQAKLERIGIDDVSEHWSFYSTTGHAFVLRSETARTQDSLGGIDFNPDHMELNIQHEGGGIKFNMDPALLQQLQGVEGFEPVIMNIQPLPNLNLFLGLKDQETVSATG